MGCASSNLDHLPANGQTSLTASSSSGVNWFAVREAAAVQPTDGSRQVGPSVDRARAATGPAGRRAAPVFNPLLRPPAGYGPGFNGSDAAAPESASCVASMAADESRVTLPVSDTRALPFQRSEVDFDGLDSLASDEEQAPSHEVDPASIGATLRRFDRRAISSGTAEENRRRSSADPRSRSIRGPPASITAPARVKTSRPTKQH